MKSTTVTALMLLVSLSLGCSKKHESFPDPLGVSQPPSVTNLVVSNPQNLDYDVSWGVGNPSLVKYYRVYASFDGVQYSLTQDSLMVTSAGFTSFAPVAAFGVTVVSTENVEGTMVTAPTP